MTLANEERALLAAARGGDVTAFADVVRLHEGRVRAVISRLLPDERDVEEAVQDTFLRAWHALGGFEGRSGFGTWLHRIGVNEAMMRLRRRRRDVADLGADVPDPRRGPADAAEAAELRRFLTLRLEELPMEQRAPLVLRDVAGLTNAEVAEVLGLTTAAVKSRVHRARVWLMLEVAAWEDGAPPPPGHAASPNGARMGPEDGDGGP